MLESLFESYLDSYCKRSYKGYDFEDSLILMGAKNMYEAESKAIYRKAIQLFGEFHIAQSCDKAEFHPNCVFKGSLFFYLQKETKEEYYSAAMEFLIKQLKEWSGTSNGAFQSNNRGSAFLLLEDSYKILPFYMEYETYRNNKENYNDLQSQFRAIRKTFFDSEKGLYNCISHETQLAGTENASFFWLRSMGFYLMALIDCLEEISQESFDHYKALEALFKEALRGLLSYQDKESKLFYQMVSLPDKKGNYLETSGSAMVSYAILKGCRLGILQEEKYRFIGECMIEGIKQYKIKETAKGFLLLDSCPSIDLDAETVKHLTLDSFFVPEVSNSRVGIAAVMLAYSEYLKLQKLEEQS